MKILVLIVAVICLFSCNGIKKDKINHLVQEWSSKQITYPDIMHFTILGADTNFLPKSEYKIISYIDSTGCTSCKLRLSQWKEFINQLDSLGNFPILFFMYPKSQNELNYILKRNHFDYPVCIDENDSFNKLNHFPSDMMFQTFLLDKNDKVVAIGNPVHNPKIKELYLNIIQGKKDVESEKTLRTEITIKEPIISLGHFNWKEEKKTAFKIENTGKYPLIINDVTTSCGCTSVDYSKEPVRPGNSISLQVTYKADHPEHFDKTITVYCNANPSLVHLKIMGDAE